MITLWLTNGIAFLSYLIGLLPAMTDADNTLISNFGNALYQLRTIVAWANFWFPVDTLFQIIFAFFGFVFSVLMFSLGRYIFRVLSVGFIK